RRGCVPSRQRRTSLYDTIVRSILLCFFFSSRRRHTRFKCDWSSDVCSSDLRRRLDEILAKHTGQDLEKVARDTERDYFMSAEERSEERRVGKECRLRGSADE